MKIMSIVELKQTRIFYNIKFTKIIEFNFGIKYKFPFDLIQNFEKYIN